MALTRAFALAAPILCGECQNQGVPESGPIKPCFLSWFRN